MSKIDDLEIMIAHQDKQIQELNEIVTRQWDEIDALKKRLQLTHDKIQELEYNVNDSGENNMSVSDEAAANKPPHY